jgi:hypothetical protein
VVESIDIKEEKIEEEPLHFDPLNVIKSNDCTDNGQFFESWMESYEHRQEMLSKMSTIEYFANLPYTLKSYLLKSDVGFELVKIYYIFLFLINLTIIPF